ncbi:MAG TPA: DUF488 family protein [Steroidobacteraceae bacterium]
MDEGIMARGRKRPPTCSLYSGIDDKRLFVVRDIQIKCDFEKPTAADGYRVLVDRLWTRGVSKERARLDVWLPAAAPSTALRKWFAHDPLRIREFRKRYRVELKEQSSELAKLRVLARKGRLTLVYGARDPNINHAAAPREALLVSAAAARRRTAQPD